LDEDKGEEDFEDVADDLKYLTAPGNFGVTSGQESV